MALAVSFTMMILVITPTSRRKCEALARMQSPALQSPAFQSRAAAVAQPPRQDDLLGPGVREWVRGRAAPARSAKRAAGSAAAAAGREGLALRLSQSEACAETLQQALSRGRAPSGSTPCTVFMLCCGSSPAPVARSAAPRPPPWAVVRTLGGRGPCCLYVRGDTCVGHLRAREGRVGRRRRGPMA